MTDLFAPAAGRETIDTNRQIGVFDPSDPSLNLYGTRRYGIPANHDKRTGYLVGADNTGYSQLMRAIEVGAFDGSTDYGRQTGFASQFGFSVPVGAQLANPPEVAGRFQAAGEAYWATAWCDALSLVMPTNGGQMSTVWGVVVGPAQDEWNRRNPQPIAPPAGPGQPGQPPVVPPPTPPAVTDAQATASALAWWVSTWQGHGAAGLKGRLKAAGQVVSVTGRDAIGAAVQPLAVAAAKAGVLDSQGRVVAK